jgi:type VI secretion system secreted protein VgrG
VRFEFDVTQELATRPVCTQYRESDLEFFSRLLASEGLSWRFEHDQADDDVDGRTGQARHRIVIFDSWAMAPATPGGEPAARLAPTRRRDRPNRQIDAEIVNCSAFP